MTDENNFSLSQELGCVLLDKGLTIAVAESCTGGGLAHQLTAVPGSSAWIDRGFVTYSNAAKSEMLGVDKNIIEQHGAVSGPVAQQMAEGALARSHADVAVSITGLAGPGGGSADKPVGTVWFGLAKRNQPVQTKCVVLLGGRKQIRRDSIGNALSWLLSEVSDMTALEY